MRPSLDTSPPTAAALSHADDHRPETNADQPTLTDRELVKRMADRDEAALGVLYDRWSGLVFSVAMRIVEREDAEEVLEDTFWQAWRQAEQYRKSRGNVATWLTMIARSRALDRRRSRRRARSRPWAALEEPSGASKADCPLADAISRQERRIILQAIGMLPADQRETVQLAYFADLSHGEIAAELNQPLGTVKTRARLAAAKLKKYLSVLRDASV